MQIVKIVFACVFLSLCLLWASDGDHAMRSYLICIRDCKYEYEDFEISPVRILYDGSEVELTRHYAEMSTVNPPWWPHSIHASSDWISQGYVVPEDEQNRRQPNIHFSGIISPPASITGDVEKGQLEYLMWFYDVYKIDR